MYMDGEIVRLCFLPLCVSFPALVLFPLMYNSFACCAVNSLFLGTLTDIVVCVTKLLGGDLCAWLCFRLGGGLVLFTKSVHNGLPG